MKVFIEGISYYLPEKVITNEDIVQQFPSWTIEKIESKIGIKERRIAAESETALDMAIAAARNLFLEDNIDVNSIDYLIFCTQSADYSLPSSACIIQDKLGLPVSIGAIDVNLGCSAWIYGLSLAKALVASNMNKKVLLLTSETYSKYMHPQDKSNRTIFGDGAAATIISDKGFAEIGEFSLGTDGKGAENLIVKTGGARTRNKLDDLSFDEFGNPISSDFLYMDGASILNYSLNVIPKLVNATLAKNNMSIDQVDLHIFHQANKYLAKRQRRKLKIEESDYYCCFEKMGNTVSSTIPIAIKEALKDKSIKPGFKILSVAQGLGYSWGGVILKF